MRELKFRIWDGNNNVYDYPDVIELNRGLEYEQSTGLHDGHGKEIYEGDIVESQYFIHSIVNYDNDISTFCAFDIPFYEAESIYWDNEWIIIGNIHENPELLE